MVVNKVVNNGDGRSINLINNFINSINNRINNLNNQNKDFNSLIDK